MKISSRQIPTIISLFIIAMSFLALIVNVRLNEKEAQRTNLIYKRVCLEDTIIGVVETVLYDSPFRGNYFRHIQVSGSMIDLVALGPDSSSYPMVVLQDVVHPHSFVRKDSGSDTLYVAYNGKSYYFKLNVDYCER